MTPQPSEQPRTAVYWRLSGALAVLTEWAEGEEGEGCHWCLFSEGHEGGCPVGEARAILEAEAAAPDPVADPTMLCGKCQHPMHWRECGADADLTAPCQCRNDVATDPVASPPDGREPAWVPFIVEAASLIGGDWAGRLQVAIEGAVASPFRFEPSTVRELLEALPDAPDPVASPRCGHPCHRLPHDTEGPTVLHLPNHEPCPVHFASPAPLDARVALLEAVVREAAAHVYGLLNWDTARAGARAWLDELPARTGLRGLRRGATALVARLEGQPEEPADD